MGALILVSSAVILLMGGIIRYAGGRVKTKARCPDCGLRMLRRVEPVGDALHLRAGGLQRAKRRFVYSCPDEHVQWVEAVDDTLLTPAASNADISW